MTMTGCHLEGLQLLGYTRRESEFLFLVATHSGYFTNRQFKTFAQTESGSVSHAFVRKLLERKHASYHAYRSGGRVYHLFARKVYQAIDRENLRTRKKHELDYIRTRLVALDFLIGHPEYRYLDTEEAKVAYFEEERNLGREVLPVKQYRARRSADLTLRYFVDRFPLFMNPQSSTFMPTFTYVDAGTVSLGAFGTHLRAYLRLFQALPNLEFIYLAPTARLFPAAEKEFYHLLNGGRAQLTSLNVVDYFRLRKAWDAKERVTSAEVVLLQEYRSRFAGSKFDLLYERWRGGTLAEAEAMEAAGQMHVPGARMFRSMICGSSLAVFTDLRGNGVESLAENPIVGTMPRVSGNRSEQIPET